MTTDTGRAMLRAILLEPADDTARVVYADFLQENGEPDRAEFIRVQVELFRRTRPVKVHTGPGNRMPVYDHGEDYDILRRRERGLLGDYSGLQEADKSYSNRAAWSMALRAVIPSQWWEHCEFRRGFVAEIRCPLAALFGGPCRWCRGSGGARDDWFPGETGGACRKCGGTGTVPGCAAELFASHPVERVEFPDREPAVLMDSTACGWQVSESTRPENPWWVGPALRDHLLAAGGRSVPNSVWVWYDTAYAARDGLNRAAVSLGRELAGLPPPSHLLV